MVGIINAICAPLLHSDVACHEAYRSGREQVTHVHAKEEGGGDPGGKEPSGGAHDHRGGDMMYDTHPFVFSRRRQDVVLCVVWEKGVYGKLLDFPYGQLLVYESRAPRA